MKIFRGLFTGLCLAIIVWETGCKQGSERSEGDVGKQLAAKNCSGCHLPPDPALLSKKVWTEQVLPAMAVKMGIEVLEGNIYFHQKQSTVSAADWSEIVKYYQQLAPDTLLTVQSVKTKGSFPFEVKTPAPLGEKASTLLVAFDTLSGQIVTGNAENQLSFLRPDLTFIKNKSMSSPPVDFQAGIVTCMGGMQASDRTKGQVFDLKKNGDSVLISQDLTRPIRTQQTDFNKDGLTDYLICAFGHDRGGLYLLQKGKDGSLQQTAIREVPGATDFYIRDVNADGWPDIIALFAHADEGIWLFTNNRKGGFESRNLLRFPPVYGSSSFQLADMNGDGQLDILYTAGDNSDYSRILKPYHGIYIFTNTGDFTFRQTFFHPVNGCTKARAADFDHDGDLDIAAIAFFADLKNQKEQTFTYLEATPGYLKPFQAVTTRLGHLGRWICMETADVDRDGDTDIILGNFSRGFLNQENVQPTWNTQLPFILLDNKTGYPVPE